jgi:ketosteroid isomerase-like protein
MVWHKRGNRKMSNAQMMRDLYDAFNRGEVPTVLGAMDPDIEWRQAEGHPYSPSGEPFRGSEAILQNVFMRLGTEWDGFTVTPKEFHDAGSVVAVEARYTGTYKQTGKSLDAQVCHVWRIRDGKITSFQQYVDTGQWQDVVGAR